MKRPVRCLVLLCGVVIAGGIVFTSPEHWLLADATHPKCESPFLPVSSAENLCIQNENFHTVAPEGLEYPFIKNDVFKPLVEAVRAAGKRGAIDKPLRAGLQGDFYALAALVLVTRLEEQKQGEQKQEEQKPKATIPAQFWEDWMYCLLGEQEGGYTLGLVASVLMHRMPPQKDEDPMRNNLARMATEALRRAAKAGHAEAMFALTVYAGAFPDPAFRMPGSTAFPIATQAMLAEPFTPERLYWLGKAAAEGSSRAKLRMGLAFMESQDKSAHNIPLGIDFIEQAVSLGNAAAATSLARYMDPRFVEQVAPAASCAQTMRAFVLAERMRDENGWLWEERPGRIGLDEASYLDTLFQQMSQGLDGFEKCLTEEKYHAILVETKAEHAAIRKALEARKSERDALYEQARTRLPELRAAYEKATAE